jgi:hypothetical protein
VIAYAREAVVRKGDAIIARGAAFHSDGRWYNFPYECQLSANHKRPGERTGSRPKPPKAGARSASLEAGRTPGYRQTSQLSAPASSPQVDADGARGSRIAVLARSLCRPDRLMIARVALPQLCTAAPNLAARAWIAVRRRGRNAPYEQPFEPRLAAARPLARALQTDLEDEQPVAR